MKRKKIAVIGCAGKMGQVVCRYLLSHSDYELAAGIDTTRCGDDLGSLLGLGSTGIPVSANLQTVLSEACIDIAIDFTAPDSVVSNAAVCLQAKIPVLIGTTGISQEDQAKLDHLAQKMHTAVMIVPNFAIGAVLMMDFAKRAAKYMKNVEIIEMHSSQKLDKPSGTAIKTRQGILEELGITDESLPEQVPIHSVRLPGLVAHQRVIFGDIGQTLTISHDSLDRDSFMPGIGLALSQMHSLTGLKVGLEV
ncbi:MAG: 4-hydroxy-tetrahydrodipicolinate reductase [Candidatus Riflebacteria bacterium]|nr:4-hydroxy-tetrahydrodipicolinate reductase [Candidatus Riflebacteria bacterium]